MARKAKKASKKKALLIYCTQEEADWVRRAAKRERRSISGFVMNAVTKRLATMHALTVLGKKPEEAGHIHGES